MIEELKGLLDVLAQTPSMAIYGLVICVGWKLFVYLSTAGSILYVLRLAIERLHDYMIKPNVIRREVVWRSRGIVFIETENSVAQTLSQILVKDIYFHEHHADWLSEAVSEKLKRDGNSEIGGEWWKSKREAAR